MNVLYVQCALTGNIYIYIFFFLIYFFFCQKYILKDKGIVGRKVSAQLRLPGFRSQHRHVTSCDPGKSLTLADFSVLIRKMRKIIALTPGVDI